jgi:sarcosine oxidase subunit beta
VSATAIRVEGGNVVGVETSEGFVSTSTAVLAAGAWSAPIARTAGVELPVTGMLLSAGILERPPGLEETHLACIDASQGIYFRPDTGRLTILGFSSAADRRESPKDVDPDDFQSEPPLEWTVRPGARLGHRIPGMVDARWQRAWSGVDGNTPDGHAILDKAPGVEGLYMAAGMSGAGFKIGPAVGMCMAELIAEGEATTVDISPFSLSRFSEGKLLVGQHEYSYYFRETVS